GPGAPSSLENAPSPVRAHNLSSPVQTSAGVDPGKPTASPAAARNSFLTGWLIASARSTSRRCKSAACKSATPPVKRPAHRRPLLTASEVILGLLLIGLI